MDTDSHKQAAARTLLRAARICARSVSGTSRNLLLAPAHWKVSKEKKKRVKKRKKKRKKKLKLEGLGTRGQFEEAMFRLPMTGT